MSACHYGGVSHALEDPHGLLFCAESDLDYALLRSPDVYRRFADRLHQLLTTQLTAGACDNHRRVVKSPRAEGTGLRSVPSAFCRFLNPPPPGCLLPILVSKRKLVWSPRFPPKHSCDPRLVAWVTRAHGRVRSARAASAVARAGRRRGGGRHDGAEFRQLPQRHRTRRARRHRRLDHVRAAASSPCDAGRERSEGLPLRLSARELGRTSLQERRLRAPRRGATSFNLNLVEGRRSELLELLDAYYVATSATPPLPAFVASAPAPWPPLPLMPPPVPPPAPWAETAETLLVEVDNPGVEPQSQSEIAPYSASALWDFDDAEWWARYRTDSPPPPP
jgi:hypothetical protein